MSKKTLGISIGIAIILMLFATFLLRGRRASTGGVAATTTQPLEQNRDLPGITYGYASTTSSGGTALPKNVLIPDLNRPVVIPKYFLPDIAVQARNSIAKLTDTLKKNPGNGALWAELGLERKEIEDYAGARDAYLYAYALTSQNPVIPDTLGVLYGYYLHNTALSESYFKKALALEPETPYRYLRLYELYHDVQKDPVKAKAILEQGLKALPGNASFTALLREYH